MALHERLVSVPEVTDAAGKLLGLNPLLKKGEAKNTFALPVTALVSSTDLPKAVPPVAAVAVQAPVAAVPTQSQGDIRLPVLAVILVVYLLAVWITRRRRNSRN